MDLMNEGQLGWQEKFYIPCSNSIRQFGDKMRSLFEWISRRSTIDPYVLLIVIPQEGMHRASHDTFIDERTGVS